MAPRIRYTMFQVTINTNRAGKTARETAFLIEMVREFIQVQLKKSSVWRNLINIEPDYSAVKKIKVDAVGIEVGTKRRFVHTHFIVLVEHTGKIQYKFTQKKWQTEVNNFMPLIKGSYVKVQLMSARAMNYTAKHSGKRTQIVNIGMQPTLTF